MSVIQDQATTEHGIRRQLRQATDPHEKSAQARGEIDSDRHYDGERLNRHFEIPPLHRYLAHVARLQNNLASSMADHPAAFIDAIVYTTDRDRQLVRDLQGEVEYDHSDPHPSHEALERYRPLRAKLLEFLAADSVRTAETRADRGTDLLLHGEPGGGKTTLGLSAAMWKMQVNNETVIWAESVDESGTNERTEWLAMAPFATLAIPDGLDTRVRIVPTDVSIDEFEVPVETIARDVIRYESVRDLVGQLTPGQFYVVFPDPLHRGCESVSKFNYHTYEETTPVGVDGPSTPTDADHWWFAFVGHRISGDTFPHPTFINLDEAGNLLDADASKGPHQHYQKIKWFRNKYADARKKGVSFGYQAHSLSEIHKFARQKIRWRVTMPGNKPPIRRRLPGDRTCPLNHDVTSDLDAGRAFSWKAPNFAKIRWPDLKTTAQLDAEVSIDFRNWQDAVGGRR